MGRATQEQLQRHVRTHSEQATIDSQSVHYLEDLLGEGGMIHTQFSTYDTWPNMDGTLDLVPDPNYSRRPVQQFSVQIKGTTQYSIGRDGSVKYQLKSLAFPAYIATEVTSDPGILFVVLDPDDRRKRRVFWKYMSASFLSSIDFGNDSMTISFNETEEIKDEEGAIDIFVAKLAMISETHSFMKQLSTREYDIDDIRRVVTVRCQNISDAIDVGSILNQSRDNVSKRILTELSDLCQGTLVLDGLRFCRPIGLRTAWEFASLDVDTKFLATFLQGLNYIGLRVPEDGQHERLMLKYYDFLWRIRKHLWDYHGIQALGNLEKFPRERNEEDEAYNKLVAAAIDVVENRKNPWKNSRYYIQKKTAFYVDKERYFEITLQLAGKYATKFNRLTVYSKMDITSNYAIQLGFEEADLTLWDAPSKIKVVTNWRVSIEPAAMNKLGKILGQDITISSKYNEYDALMVFLTRTGINLLDFIDMQTERFGEHLDRIYEGQKTLYFKEVLSTIHKRFYSGSKEYGRNTIRLILLRMREEVIEKLLPERGDKPFYNRSLQLSPGCSTFERNPAIYNLPNQKTNNRSLPKDVSRAVGSAHLKAYLPYIRIRQLINTTGELCFLKEDIERPDLGETIDRYNGMLGEWDVKHGVSLKEDDGYVYIDEYVDHSVFILRRLLQMSLKGNDGQMQVNQQYLKTVADDVIDPSKKIALENAFVDSRIMAIYGAAGTGKTTLMNYLSNLMDGRSKLFLAKTHTALENLKRRIDSPGRDSEFSSIDRIARSSEPLSYDMVFIDECSTIDNRSIVKILKKLDEDTLVILAGDIFQIESIDFGNWFYYAKDILPKKAVVELSSNWRTRDVLIQGLWDEVRFRQPNITERLVIDGPFSENISKKIFIRQEDDEVVLCLNYDGKFGLNSINSYFQDANPEPSFFWQEWRYKVGDPILFNESKRFPKLYNNLKGKIVEIEQSDEDICFTIDVNILLTALDARNAEFEWVSSDESSTRIRFKVYDNDGGTTEEERELARMRSVVPFQLAYAVSIHKAQGLEYNSIKIIIPNSNSESISHGIFYTAITRTKQLLKIYWSADTMQKIVAGFSTAEQESRSLELIKKKLHDKCDT